MIRSAVGNNKNTININMMDFSRNENENSIEYNRIRSTRARRRLSPSFQPGPCDVLCCKGKKAYNHEGNVAFRALVKFHQKSYDAVSNCKYIKSKIVSKIVDTVRASSPNGGFVKFIDGAWYEIGDRAAKEKCGQALRNLLHNNYSSSTKSKAKVRQLRRMQEYGAELGPYSYSSESASVVSDEESSSDESFEPLTLPSFAEAMPNPNFPAMVESSPLVERGISIFGGHFFPTDETNETKTNSFPTTSLPTAPVDMVQADCEIVEDALEEDMKRDFCEAMGVFFEV